MSWNRSTFTRFYQNTLHAINVCQQDKKEITMQESLSIFKNKTQNNLDYCDTFINQKLFFTLVLHRRHTKYNSSGKLNARQFLIR